MRSAAGSWRRGQIIIIAVACTPDCKMSKAQKRTEFRQAIVYARTIKCGSFIGIDPGTQTGCAIVLKTTQEEQIIKMCTGTFWDILDDVLMAFWRHQAIVAVECSTSYRLFHGDDESPPRKMGKIGQSVGAVRRESELLISGLLRHGVPVAQIEPLGKLLAPAFQKVTGYECQTNQHERDAAMMALWASNAPRKALESRLIQPPEK